MSRISILILEDNDEKIQNILVKYKDLFKNNEVFIARSVETAKWYISADPGGIWLFLDYELAPGCGTGTEFLDWMLAKAPQFLHRVIAISYSLEACKLWRAMCEKAGIPIERSWS